MTTLTRSIPTSVIPRRGFDYLSEMNLKDVSSYSMSSSAVGSLLSTLVGDQRRIARRWTEILMDWNYRSEFPQVVLKAGGTLLMFSQPEGARVRWLEPTLSRVEHLMALDVEAAGPDLPPAPSSVVDALRFFARALPANAAAPSLAPLNDGGLQAEWHRGGLDVEIVFSTDEDERGVYIREKNTGEERELPLDETAFAAAVGDRLNLT
jgi:hypothetical protein